jgi:hypothetical protein
MFERIELSQREIDGVIVGRDPKRADLATASNLHAADAFLVNRSDHGYSMDHELEMEGVVMRAPSRKPASIY